ncbi:MAG: hypothetical protein ACR2NZ_16890 [Rubripirellula sp.]
MSRSTLLLLACGFVVLLPSVPTQGADNQSSSDPFAGGGKSASQNRPAEAPKNAPAAVRVVADDPFGADPFGGGGKKSAGNPNGRNRITDDPFAEGPSNAARKGRKPPAGVTRAVSATVKSARHPDETQAAYIRRRLGERTSLQAIEMPLEDFAGLVAETVDIPVVINRRALEELGLSIDLPVNVQFRDLSLRSVLRIALEEFDLTYAVRNEVLEITTDESAEQNLVLETYTFPASISSKSDQVVLMLVRSVSPNKWDQLGGTCTVSALDNVLVVSATEPVHEGVVEFLEKIDAAYKRHVDRPKGGH